MEQGDLEESKQYFDEALNSLRASSDNSCRELYAAGLRFLALWHEKQEQLEEAERLLRESIEILKSLGNDGATQMAYSICDLSFVLIRTEHISEAEKLLESAMQILKLTIGQEDPKYDWAKILYKACLQKGDQDLMADTVEFLTAQLQWKTGPGHPNLIRAVHAYEAGLKKKGMTDRIEEVRERFSSILK